jgi:hypothetical protein
MAIQKWCIQGASLYDKPGGKKQNIFVTVNNLYDVTSHQQVFQGKAWSEIRFVDRGGIERTGWVQDVYLEDLVEDPDSQGFEVHIPHPTPDSTDAAQYLIWEKPRHVNMCGELCVAYIGGDDIETFLTKWRQMVGTKYKTIVPLDKKTGPDELDNMLKVYGYPSPNIRFEVGLEIPGTEFRMSPGRFQKMLVTHYLIAAVRIDGVAGNIGEGDIGHWVVLDKVIPDGVDRGWVEVYNPFPNKRQKYSYDEFIRSCKAEGWTGLWVNRIPPLPNG